jgi:ribosomal protein S18 acetylase RimI-like enzyme/nitroimidazol reductase NimA-like FMN-containing flavoprotein (pyridoxamine 5'-phosphate oxidase superfamily)
MRKEIYRLDRGEALALPERAPAVHVATTTPDGAPVLRVVHGVLAGGRLCFHGAPAGEKIEALGREAVASAEETIASIPSYFVDPERACPATTYYRSAQVHARLEPVDDPALKAEVLGRLMAKYQPEGGHVPIEATHPLYRKAIEGLLVVGMSLARVDGKAKLGQNRRPEELRVVLERLWRRGEPGDPRAIELVRAASPGLGAPGFLEAPEGASLVCHLDERDAAAAAELAADTYWNYDLTREQLARAHLGSSAWVGARDASGALVATARAASDTAKRAWIYDVVVAPAWRGRGLGEAVMRLLLDHPAVRGARWVLLGTRDAQPFYARFGFRDAADLPSRPYRSTQMVLDRG